MTRVTGNAMTARPRHAIAITGGIGSGKTYLCNVLAARGIRIYDCDSAARRIMQKSDDVRRRLTRLIGSCAYTPSGALDKAAVAKFLLESEGNAKAINAIVHPAVAEDFLASGYRWMECPLLFESGFHKLVDVKVCVVAPLETRVERIMRRDGITRAKALEWVGRQMEQEEVAARCEHIIVNDGLSPVEPQADRLLHILERQQ